MLAYDLLSHDYVTNELRLGTHATLNAKCRSKKSKQFTLQFQICIQVTKNNMLIINLKQYLVLIKKFG